VILGRSASSNPEVAVTVAAHIFATADPPVAAPKLRALADDLAEAVERTALTNDLVQSRICTSLFCGWGFGLIGRLDRTTRYAMMLLVCLA